MNQGELWGQNGALARCATPKLLNDSSGWRLADAELLRSLNLPDFGNDDPENRNLVQYAIVVDLRPDPKVERGERLRQNAREVLMARLVRIWGYLDPPNNPRNRNDRYNPSVFEFEELLHIQGWEPPEDQASREQMKITIPNRGDGTIIRSINYFHHCWCTTGRFRGALLWPQHWEWLSNAGHC